MNEFLRERLETINKQIKEATERCDRKVRDVKLIGATKKVEPKVLKWAFEEGLTCFGENRAQELKAKVSELPESCEWHFIGSLQTNKVKDVVPLARIIQSVDRFQLAHEIDKRAASIGKSQKVLVEVNIGEEESKQGIKPAEAEELILTINEFRHLEVIGLMTIAPFLEDVEKVRPFFVKLRELRDRIQQRTGIRLPELSMGMSHDFEVAIEEGATMIRVGTAIFGDRPEDELEE